MAGQINEHPLAELIREIAAGGLSGALRLAREPAKAVVYFERGETVLTVSNLRTYRLLECLKRWGILTERQAARFPATLSDQELSAALVKDGVLNNQKVEELVARQASETLRPVLLWTDGFWDFDPRVRIAEEAQAKTEVRELLMESARRLPAEFVVSRFAGAPPMLSPAAEIPAGINLLTVEGFVLSRLDAPISLGDLLSISGLPEAETLRAVYTLALGSFIQRDPWPQALTADEIAKARAVKTSPAAAPKAAERGAPEKAAAPAAPPELDERKELDRLFARLDAAADHYEILGVYASANAGEVKRAYHGLAKRFHPDRFRKETEAGLYERVEAAFARIAQAYEVLKDKQTRAAYDSRPDRPKAASRETTAPADGQGQARPSAAQQPDDSSAKLGEEKFRQGVAALRQGNRAQALACFKEAARLVPRQPQYRAFYGRAMAGDEQTRRNAETEFKAAIALDSSNASYYVMLAELYADQGLHRRAEGELARALSFDPQNKAAQRMLENLRLK
ncbi:MAG TPA: DnaJ domain-containing protein [Pyrinomonadaceae bacterium]|jgi:curved DNA-binding protein CbpA